MADPKPEAKRPLMSVADLARRLSRSEAAVRSMHARGEIPGFRKFGRRVFFDPDVIDDWIEKKRVWTPADDALRDAAKPQAEPPKTKRNFGEVA